MEAGECKLRASDSTPTAVKVWAPMALACRRARSGKADLPMPGSPGSGAIRPLRYVTHERADDLRLFVASDQLPRGHDTRVGEDSNHRYGWSPARNASD